MRNKGTCLALGCKAPNITLPFLDLRMSAKKQKRNDPRQQEPHLKRLRMSIVRFLAPSLRAPPHPGCIAQLDSIGEASLMPLASSPTDLKQGCQPCARNYKGHARRPAE